MRIQKRENRELILNAIGGLIFDILVAVSISYIFSFPEFGSVFVFFALQAMYLFVWLRRTVYRWGYWLAGGKTKMTSAFLDYLRMHGYPDPGHMIPSAENYFEEVAEREDIPLKTRFAAVAQASELRLLGSLGLIQTLLQMNLAFEAALDRYQKSFSDTPSLVSGARQAAR